MFTEGKTTGRDRLGDKKHHPRDSGGRNLLIFNNSKVMLREGVRPSTQEQSGLSSCVSVLVRSSIFVFGFSFLSCFTVVFFSS